MSSKACKDMQFFNHPQSLNDKRCVSERKITGGIRGVSSTSASRGHFTECTGKIWQMAGKHMERKAGNEMMEEQGMVSMGDTCPCWLMVKTRIFAKYGLKHSVRYFNFTQQRGVTQGS